MTQTQSAIEHTFPAIREQFRQAIGKIIDRQSRSVVDAKGGSRIVFGPSLLDQLTDDVGAIKASEREGSSHSQPPIWSDAFDHLRKLDHLVRGQVADLLHERGAGSSVYGLLVALSERTLRPADTPLIDAAAKDLRKWTVAALALLSPEPIRHVSAPCPACNAEHVYREDSAGEVVRVPALKITDRGCQCQACRHTWAPELYMHLARVLGFDLPEGVLA